MAFSQCVHGVYAEIMEVVYQKYSQNNSLRETLIKAFPSLDLRCEAANSFANPCDPPEVFKEMLI